MELVKTRATSTAIDGDVGYSTEGGGKVKTHIADIDWTMKSVCQSELALRAAIMVDMWGLC